MLGIDYAWAHPSPASITAAGYGFVLRYLSPDQSKNLTAGEAQALLAAGLDIGVVWEATANRVLAGASAGAADGARAKQEAAAAGAPDHSAIYFAVDFPAQPAQYAAIDAYNQAFAAAIAPHPVGVYGGAGICDHLASTVALRWQTGAWSGGRRSAGICLYQRIGYVNVGGIQCDVDEQLGPFGGWRVPVPTIQEARVALNAPICAVAARPDGTGYWLLAEDFGVFSFGNVQYLGHPNDGNDSHDGHSGGKPVAIVSSPTGQGYTIFASDGGVFTYGDAQFHGTP